MCPYTTRAGVSYGCRMRVAPRVERWRRAGARGRHGVADLTGCRVLQLSCRRPRATAVGCWPAGLWGWRNSVRYRFLMSAPLGRLGRGLLGERATDPLHHGRHRGFQVARRERPEHVPHRHLVGQPGESAEDHRSSGVGWKPEGERPEVREREGGWEGGDADLALRPPQEHDR